MRVYVHLKRDMLARQNLPAVYASQQFYDQEAQLVALAESKSIAEHRQRMVHWLLIAVVILLLAAAVGIGYARYTRRLAALRLAEARVALDAATRMLEEKNRQLLARRPAETPADTVEDDTFNTPGTPDIATDDLSDTTILTDDDWQTYRSQFEAAYPGFFGRLREYISAPTEGEERLCALLRLGLDYKRIADVLGISSHGSRKGMYRLRLRLGLDNTDALREWVEGV